VIILPVDQGFEHGPARSFGPNPPSYDPAYHFQLAIDAGLNAYASLLGFLEASAADFAGEIAVDSQTECPRSAARRKGPTRCVDSFGLRCSASGVVAIGYTIYPGTAERRLQYEQLRELAREAKASGLVVVVWSYPRGGGLSKEGETALDVIAYGAQIAALLGAHIIKVKMPTAHLELPDARKVYEDQKIPRDTAADRVRHVVQSAFNGRRIVLFSGGPKESDEALFAEARAVRDGGGFGSIIGRNSFQRDKAAALRLLDEMVRIYQE
jgi:class I fructose-bisphosphate aldolase